MCSNMTRDQLKELFKAIDKDNNRTISVQELRNYFASIWDEDEAEGFAKYVMQKYDIDHSGTLTLKEFLRSMDLFKDLGLVESDDEEGPQIRD